MAKRRRAHQRPQTAKTERLRLSNAEPEDDSEERRAILAQLPPWARLMRTRGTIVVGAALVGGIIAYNALGSVAGPAVAAGVLIGAGLVLWRADVLERRERAKNA